MAKTKQEKIVCARSEALRFVALCDELIERYAKDEYFREYMEIKGAWRSSTKRRIERYAKDEYFREYMEITGFKETAAVKRASMDLSRVLSEMRK